MLDIKYSDMMDVNKASELKGCTEIIAAILNKKNTKNLLP